MSLAQDNTHVFKCAASVAPVTDWTYYGELFQTDFYYHIDHVRMSTKVFYFPIIDTIYTERYMGLPFDNDNIEGYNTARLSTKYEDFRNKTYLLVHGSLDDNVHYQQSMALSRSLEVNDIKFEQIVGKIFPFYD